jgi:hypothetical protein
VFAIGRPIEMRVTSDVIGSTVDQIVVSVGPYMFHSDPISGSSA